MLLEKQDSMKTYIHTMRFILPLYNQVIEDQIDQHNLTQPLINDESTSIRTAVFEPNTQPTHINQTPQDFEPFLRCPRQPKPQTSPRRSTKEHRSPTWHQNYKVNNTTCSYDEVVKDVTSTLASPSYFCKIASTERELDSVHCKAAIKYSH